MVGFAAYWLDTKDMRVWIYKTPALLPLIFTVRRSFSTPCHRTLSNLQWGMNLSSCTWVDRSGLCHLSLCPSFKPVPPLHLFPLSILSSPRGSGRHYKSAFLMCPPLVPLLLIEGSVFLRVSSPWHCIHPSSSSQSCRCHCIVCHVTSDIRCETDPCGTRKSRCLLITLLMYHKLATLYSYVA